MKYILLFSGCFFVFISGKSQKKALDHSVYNGWQSVEEKLLSNNGRWAIYTIDLQEGDNELVIQATDGTYKLVVPRGYNARLTANSRFVVFSIKATYQDTRAARIKKTRPDDFPKDSLGILELGQDSVVKIALVKNFSVPAKNGDWLAFQLEKKGDARDGATTPREIDSLHKVIDSLRLVLAETQKVKNSRNRDDGNAAANEDADEILPETKEKIPTDLVLRNLDNGQQKIYYQVSEYLFSKTGSGLLMEIGPRKGDTAIAIQRLLLLVNLNTGETDTLSKGGNDFRNFAFSEDGTKLAFLAERSSRPQDLQKFYGLWYFDQSMDSAILLADKNAAGMRLGMTVSENGALTFSHSASRVFFGSAPILPPKDTSLVDIDLARLDLWHYKDEYLQPAQLKNLQEDLKESFLSVCDLEQKTIRQLGSKELPEIIQTDQGDGDIFIGVTDFGKRVESQWEGRTKHDIYAVEVSSGSERLIKSGLSGSVYPSSTGKYIVWYDRSAKNYFSWDGETTRNISRKIRRPLYNEENDIPDEPAPYGIMAWQEKDSFLYVYDRYEVWKLDPAGKSEPALLENIAGHAVTGDRGKSTVSYRYLKTDPEERYISPGETLYFRVTSGEDKTSVIIRWQPGIARTDTLSQNPQAAYNFFCKARDREVYLYSRETFTQSPDLFTAIANDSTQPLQGSRINFNRLSAINSQQQNYLWGTAGLFKWKAYNGREATGMIYRPDNFDPKKKYPMICYFYEKLSDDLYRYYSPAPIRSAINIPFYTSRGYIIFIPDIEYKIGHPGKSAFDYVVSGARALVKLGFVDSSNIALQGHSWGGYQVAQLITMTKLFKAAWAGAPVANMTSAYGGIRWESGINRQFQYEKTQSRIGATLWEKPQLYIENSPLFHLQNVSTPLVMMHNDNDGAVPWYQGIEMFTALRRLHKKVWLFNYNGEGHGLTNRNDKLDYQIRMQQFFDWILKGATPARWITDGLPAVKKGKDWALEQ